jgi:dTDP-4-dehydrorhamnose reductase
MDDRAGMRLALIGSGGMLATKIRELAPVCYELFPLDLPEFDLTDPEQVSGILGEIAPHLIVNCAAFTNVDGCETAEEAATLVNGQGPLHLARTAMETGAVLVHISTDYVFDGTGHSPYTEDDPPNPMSAYGRSKRAGEKAILNSGLEKFFIVRTSWLYGPGGKNFVETIARLAGERKELRIVADQVGSPTYTADLAAAIFNLVASPSPRAYGLYHFANEGFCSWHEFAAEIVAQLRKRGAPLSVERIVPIRTEDYPLPARRPAWSVFSKEKYRQATGADIPSWQESLVRYMEERGKS